MVHETVNQQEVAVGVLLLAEEGVDHRTGGIVHRDQQRERRCLIPQPRVMTAVHLDISIPSRGIRCRRTRCLGGRLRRGLLSPALTRMRRRVVLPVSMPSRSPSNSLRWVWLAPAYLVRANALRRPPRHRVLRWAACGPGDREQGRQRPSPGKPPGCAWCAGG